MVEGKVKNEKGPEHREERLSSFIFLRSSALFSQVDFEGGEEFFHDKRIQVLIKDGSSEITKPINFWYMVLTVFQKVEQNM